jgi:hypothetical protein
MTISQTTDHTTDDTETVTDTTDLFEQEVLEAKAEAPEVRSSFFRVFECCVALRVSLLFPHIQCFLFGFSRSLDLRQRP